MIGVDQALKPFKGMILVIEFYIDVVRYMLLKIWLIGEQSSPTEK